MLILTRKLTEAVYLIDRRTKAIIGKVVFSESQGRNKIRLGFEFPKDVEILREELKESSLTERTK